MSEGEKIRQEAQLYKKRHNYRESGTIIRDLAQLSKIRHNYIGFRHNNPEISTDIQ
jgi:hypothetical protein